MQEVLPQIATTPPPVFDCMPRHVVREIVAMASGYTDFFSRLFEVRLRAGHRTTLTFDGENLPLCSIPDKADITATFTALCNRSVYAYTESLREGYLYAFGCRVGVAGRAVIENGHIMGQSDVHSLSVRLPHRVPGAGEAALSLFHRMGGRQGLLVYAPPGVGKTTLLQDFAYTLAAGYRVALVDTRGELYSDDAPPACQIDVLRGYPPERGIEIAARVLSPQVIILDEIGSEKEAAAILSVAGCGIPLVASAHGGSLSEVLDRAPIRLLRPHGVFGGYLGIHRTGGGYTYTAETEEALCSV